MHAGHRADSQRLDIARDFAALGSILRGLRLKYPVTARIQIVELLRQTTPRDTEERALRLIACRPFVRPDELYESQLPSGAWSASLAAQPGNCYHTALALMALKADPNDHRAILASARAFRWLESMRGLEAHWLWKWKFRYFDRQVRFDTTKNGWPWIDGTVSWVAPTALVMLAHHVWRRELPRIEHAVAMLKDRACPKGGWNAGNPEVFGVPLDPHPDFTAMALLALQGAYRSDEPLIATAFDYLHRRLMTSDSLYSLAWALLAMNTWRYPQAGTIDQRLNECLITSNMDKVPSRTLALVALALETPPCSLFGGKP